MVPSRPPALREVARRSRLSLPAPAIARRPWPSIAAALELDDRLPPLAQIQEWARRRAPGSSMGGLAPLGAAHRQGDDAAVEPLDRTARARDGPILVREQPERGRVTAGDGHIEHRRRRPDGLHRRGQPPVAGDRVDGDAVIDEVAHEQERAHLIGPGPRGHQARYARRDPGRQRLDDLAVAERHHDDATEGWRSDVSQSLRRPTPSGRARRRADRERPWPGENRRSRRARPAAAHDRSGRPGARHLSAARRSRRGTGRRRPRPQSAAATRGRSPPPGRRSIARRTANRRRG